MQTHKSLEKISNYLQPTIFKKVENLLHSLQADLKKITKANQVGPICKSYRERIITQGILEIENAINIDESITQIAKKNLMQDEIQISLPNKTNIEESSGTIAKKIINAVLSVLEQTANV